MSLKVGDRVRVSADFSRNTLPSGTIGTVTYVVPGEPDAFFFTADDGQGLVFGPNLFGMGYPLFGDEVEPIEESVDA